MITQTPRNNRKNLQKELKKRSVNWDKQMVLLDLRMLLGSLRLFQKGGKIKILTN